MGVPERGAAEAAQRIADALDGAGLPYAIGGALALAIAGVPRGTADVDVNVFVADSRVPEAMDVLAALGIDIDRAASLARAGREGMFIGRWDGIGKDLVDLERLVAVRPELDCGYIRRWIVEMMGEEDERTLEWDDIVLKFRP